MKPINFGRTPTTFLNVLEKDKAQPGEIMMSYDAEDFGHLFMKSKLTDEVHDLRQNLQDISAETAEKITVLIDDKEYSLYELLYDLKSKSISTVRARPINNDIVYIQKQYSFDQSSIETDGNFVQLAGFPTAKEGQIPMKKDGKLIWVTPSTIGSGNSSSTGNADSNADDGIVSGIINLEPMNDKIYLLASKRQVSKYIKRNCNVYLPTTMDGYSEISWCVITNSYTPQFTFASTVKWLRGSGRICVPNAVNLYNFKTWDYGKTWIGSVDRYDGTNINTNAGPINIEELKEYFYTKEEVNENFYDKQIIEDKFIDTNEAEDYITKEGLINILSWRNGEDLKEGIENNTNTES